MADLIIIIILFLFAVVGSGAWSVFVTFVAMGWVIWRRVEFGRKQESEISKLSTRVAELEADLRQLRTLAKTQETATERVGVAQAAKPPQATAPAWEPVGNSAVLRAETSIPVRQPAPSQPAAPVPATQ